MEQKGFDLIATAADELMREDLAIVALGTGMPEYEALFESLAADILGAQRSKSATITPWRTKSRPARTCS